jgi:hypothetical protein
VGRGVRRNPTAPEARGGRSLSVAAMAAAAGLGVLAREERMELL